MCLFYDCSSVPINILTLRKNNFCESRRFDNYKNYKTSAEGAVPQAYDQSGVQIYISQGDGLLNPAYG